jgi:hypothetical protein
MASKREVELGKKAAEVGLRLEHTAAGYRIVNADTGTLVAAVWTTADGYGLDLDQVAAVLDGTFAWPPPVPVVEAEEHW